MVLRNELILIKSNISNNKEIKDSISRLVEITNFLDNELEKSLILLSNRYNRFIQETNLGIINGQIELNAIIFALIDVINSILNNVHKYENEYYKNSGESRNEEDLNKAISMIDYSIDNKEENILLGQKLYKIGWKYLNMKINSKAIYFLKLSIAHNPDNPWSYSKLGRAYLQQRKIDLAIDSFNKSIDKNASDKDYIFAQIGYLYLLKNKNDKAEEYFKKAISIYYEYSWAHGKLGRSLYETGKYEKSIEHFEIALNFYSNEPRWCLEHLSYNYEALGNHLKAKEYQDKAMKLKEGY